jgi:hypothetical protein
VGVHGFDIKPFVRIVTRDMVMSLDAESATGRPTNHLTSCDKEVEKIAGRKL